MAVLLECKNLSKNYGNKLALKQINLTIPTGKIVGLLGKNGSGKTTLIKLINNLLVPTTGEVLVSGSQPGVETKKIISYLPERTYLDRHMTVSSALKFFQDFYSDFNLKTARKAGVASTGNASKASYASPVSVAPFNFYLQPGTLTKEELYAAAGEKAILITFMKGAHAGANPVTGDFSLESKGFLIENGSIVRPVQGITVAGNFFDLLNNIRGLADDLEFSRGITSYGAPSTLVDGLTVAGE